MTEKKSENSLLRLLAVPFIVAWGFVFVLGALWPGLRNTIENWLGEVNFVYLGVGFLFFYTAVLVAEKNLLRQKFVRLLEEIQNFFLGPDHRQVSGAVEILIKTLDVGGESAAQTAARELKRLTNQDFGIDHAAWSEWWKKNRMRFLRERRDASLAEEGRSHDTSE